MANAVVRILRRNILVGVVVATPVIFAAYVVYLLFRFFTGNPVVMSLARFLAARLPGYASAPGIARALAVILVLAFFFLVGFIVRSFLGRRIYRLGERLLERIPVFNKIYIWFRQVGEAFLAQRQTLFKEVVLVQYPRLGVYSLGFVTTATATALQRLTGGPDAAPCANVFLPTTPNPTSGMMIVVPRSELIPLAISVADAMKIVMSAGAVYPDGMTGDDRPTLLDKLEWWLTREPPPGAEPQP